jgi:predicted AAA+ superfamily ATPase
MRIETLKEVILSNEEYIKKNQVKIIERDNILFPTLEGKVVILYGVRRSGKTFILYDQFLKNCDRAIYIDFEDDHMVNFHLEDFEKLKGAVLELKPEIAEKKIFFLFDEIQNVPGFEKFARRMVEHENTQVYVSSSSSKLKPSQISIVLRGRSWNIEVLPFSFKESLKALDIEINKSVITTNYKSIIKRNFLNFLIWGGFPEIVLAKTEFEKKKILKEYLNAIFFKDLVGKYEISNIPLLNVLFDQLFSSYSTKLSLTALYKQYKDKLPFSKDSLFEYHRYFLESMLIFEVRKFSESIYKRTRNPAKLYLVDVGLAKDTISPNFGKRLENIVFIELKRRGYEIYYFDEKGECDFIIKKDNEFNAIQVSYELNELNREREVKGLVEACKFLGTKRGIILTYDDEEKFKFDEIDIEVTPTYKWLLNLS